MFFLGGFPYLSMVLAVLGFRHMYTKRDRPFPDYIDPSRGWIRPSFMWRTHAVFYEQRKTVKQNITIFIEINQQEALLIRILVVVLFIEESKRKRVKQHLFFPATKNRFV